VTPGPRAFFWETGTAGAMVRGHEVPREMLDEDTLKEEIPIGTGPFMFEDMRAGSWEQVERNPNYWLEDRPYLDGKRHTLMPDPSARESQFRTGDLHSLGFTDVRQADSVEDGMGDRMRRITYPSDSGMALLANIRRAPFDDERVREAIHRAVDIGRIINVVYFGDAQQSWVFSPGRPTRFPLGRDAVQEYVGHDKERAAAELIQASGYDGRTIELMVPSEVPTWIDGGQLAAADLQDIGLNIEVEPIPRNIYLGRAGDKPEDPGGASDFDLTMSVFLDYHHFTSFPPTFWNNAGLEDEEIDAIVGEIHQAVDPEQRQELSQQFEMMMAEGYSNFFPLLSVNSHQGWSSQVHGLDLEQSRSGAAGWQIDMWLES
jgi:peptide/nickel transport system substrate-binding protein